MTKLIVAFRNFATAPENVIILRLQLLIAYVVHNLTMAYHIGNKKMVVEFTK
jgi:hypothetical protein